MLSTQKLANVKKNNIKRNRRKINTNVGMNTATEIQGTDMKNTFNLIFNTFPLPNSILPIHASMQWPPCSLMSGEDRIPLASLPQVVSISLVHLHADRKAHHRHLRVMVLLMAFGLKIQGSGTPLMLMESWTVNRN